MSFGLVAAQAATVSGSGTVTAAQLSYNVGVKQSSFQTTRYGYAAGANADTPDYGTINSNAYSGAFTVRYVSCRSTTSTIWLEIGDGSGGVVDQLDFTSIEIEYTPGSWTTLNAVDANYTAAFGSFNNVWEWTASNIWNSGDNNFTRGFRINP
jgi:hypothetical protein